HNGLQATIEAAEQYGVAQGADRLFEPCACAVLVTFTHTHQGGRTSNVHRGPDAWRRGSNVNAYRCEAMPPGSDHWEAAYHLGLEQTGDLLRITNRAIEYVTQECSAHAEQSREQESQNDVQLHVR